MQAGLRFYRDRLLLPSSSLMGMVPEFDPIHTTRTGGCQFHRFSNPPRHRIRSGEGSLWGVASILRVQDEQVLAFLFNPIMPKPSVSLIFAEPELIPNTSWFMEIGIQIWHHMIKCLT